MLPWIVQLEGERGREKEREERGGGEVKMKGDILDGCLPLLYGHMIHYDRVNNLGLISYDAVVTYH